MTNNTRTPCANIINVFISYHDVDDDDDDDGDDDDDDDDEW